MDLCRVGEKLAIHVLTEHAAIKLLLDVLEALVNAAGGTDSFCICL